jgi:hypothetical protein
VNKSLRTWVATGEVVGRTTAATFISTWLISSKITVRNVQYSGGAALVSLAVSILALLNNHRSNPSFTPAPAPPKPPG